MSTENTQRITHLRELPMLTTGITQLHSTAVVSYQTRPLAQRPGTCHGGCLAECHGADRHPLRQPRRGARGGPLKPVSLRANVEPVEIGSNSTSPARSGDLARHPARDVRRASLRAGVLPPERSLRVPLAPEAAPAGARGDRARPARTRLGGGADPAPPPSEARSRRAGSG